MAANKVSSISDTSSDTSSDIGKSSYVMTKFLSAVSKGHNKTVECFIRKDIEINYVDSNGDTATHFVCRNGHVSTLVKLLEAGAGINHINRMDYSPLCIATINNHYKVMGLLYLVGASNEHSCNHLADTPKKNLVNVIQKIDTWLNSCDDNLKKAVTSLQSNGLEHTLNHATRDTILTLAKASQRKESFLHPLYDLFAQVLIAVPFRGRDMECTSRS